ncbi:hypothetical protein ACFFU9_09635 [Mariniflexile ostreae]|uniref:Uncharacterized protein n=1 Tax=Mariniflexile ostreae TaxID=1520892 RepID=A0ABV5FC36_9FLAO
MVLNVLQLYILLNLSATSVNYTIEEISTALTALNIGTDLLWYMVETGGTGPVISPLLGTYVIGVSFFYWFQVLMMMMVAKVNCGNYSNSRNAIETRRSK